MTRLEYAAMADDIASAQRRHAWRCGRIVDHLLAPAYHNFPLMGAPFTLCGHLFNGNEPKLQLTKENCK